MKNWRRRWHYWREADRREAALREEMDEHRAMVREELVNAGLSERDAEAEACRRFGAMAYHAEEARAAWLSRWWTDFWADLRYAVRMMRRSPSVTATAVISAALGIGVSTGIFSVGTGLLSQPLRVAQPDRLLSLSGRSLKSGSIGNSLAWPEVKRLNESTRTLTGVSAYFPGVQGMFHTRTAERYWGAVVSANYFEVARPPFVLGGGFAPDDDQYGRPPKVVLSHGLWQAQFNSDPAICGRAVQLNGRPVMVMGVTGPGFRGTDPAVISQFWIPFSMATTDVPFIEKQMMEAWDSRWLFGLARLKPGVTLTQAYGELDVIAARLRSEDRDDDLKNRAFHLEGAGRLFAGVRGAVETMFWLLLGVSVLVVLIACANIANLLLARAAARQKEIATRLAIGAGRGRLIRQLLTESTVLAVTGGICGLTLCWLTLPLLGRLDLPLPFPLEVSAGIDPRALAFALAISVMTGLAFGLMPAWRASRGASLVVRNGGGRLRDALVVTQVMVAVLLLVSAGLALRALRAASQMDPGIGARNLLMVAVDPGLLHYSPERERQFFNQVTRDVSALPGVEAISSTTRLPVSILGISVGVRDVRRKGKDARWVNGNVYGIGAGFFDALRVPMSAGEDFRDGQRDVVILNETAASKLFQNENPLGLMISDLCPRSCRVIGVVKDFTSSTIGAPAAPGFFLPRWEEGRRSAALFGTYFIIRTAHEPLSYLPQVREAIHRFDPGMAILDTKSWGRHLDQALLVPRLTATIVGFCGAMGFIIAAIGLYGVIRFTVERRSRELGIRMALGARREDVVRLILRQGAWLGTIGIMLGATLGLIAGRAAEGLLYGVRGMDPLTYALVIPGVTFIVLLATWLPARRAARLDPMITLRCE